MAKENSKSSLIIAICSIGVNFETKKKCLMVSLEYIKSGDPSKSVRLKVGNENLITDIEEDSSAEQFRNICVKLIKSCRNKPKKNLRLFISEVSGNRLGKFQEIVTALEVLRAMTMIDEPIDCPALEFHIRKDSL